MCIYCRNACAVGFEGKLYVFGGDTGKCFATAPDDYQATKKRYYVSPSAFWYVFNLSSLYLTEEPTTLILHL